MRYNILYIPGKSISMDLDRNSKVQTLDQILIGK